MSLRRWRIAVGCLVKLGFLVLVQHRNGAPAIYRFDPTGALDAPVHLVHRCTWCRGTGAPRARPPVHQVHSKEYQQGVPEGVPLDARPSGSRRVAARAKRRQSNGNGNGASKETWLTAYIAAWHEAYGGFPNAGMLAKHLRPLHEAHGEAETLRRFQNYLRATDAKFVSIAKFAQTHGAYAGASGENGARDHVLKEKMQRSAEVLRRFVEGGDR